MNSQKRQVSPLKSRNEIEIKKPKFDENLKNLSNLFDDDDDDFGCLDLEKITNNENSSANGKVSGREALDLSKWKRCVVVDLERDKKTYSLILHLNEDLGGEIYESAGVENGKDAATRCYLQDAWSHAKIDVGAVLSLIAVWDSDLAAYKINKEHGFCVINPDFLISGTTVVGSLFCKRKAVLQELFKGIDANSKVMVVGSIVHELLQEALSDDLDSLDKIIGLAQKKLDSQDMMYTLYSSLMTRDEADVEVQKFIPTIAEFIEQYIRGAEPNQIVPGTFQGVIEEIVDIEENLWTPQLGLKGKIDVSVRIKPSKKFQTLKSFQMHKKANTIPLEIKTGRATFSLEHKGQLILYQMMLSALGQDTQSGLLLYLRENLMREVSGARNEQRDLVMLRNELAYYLSKTLTEVPSNKTLDLSNGKFIQPFELPEPISHHSACGNCPYATVCCAFAKTDSELQLREGHPLLKVSNEVLKHLKSADYEYFIHWCFLLALEGQEAKKSIYQRALWTETPEARQQEGRAIVGLKLLTVVKDENRYRHELGIEDSKDENSVADLTLSGFSLGEYVIVSSEKRLAIASGCISKITSSVLSISLERDLSKNYGGQHFIVDKHESQSGNVFNFTNLSVLLDDTEVSNKLRKIVIEKAPPIYHKSLPKLLQTKGKEIFEELNNVQRSAVLKALQTDSYMLIKGLPGTGKTQTLVAIVRLLHLLGKSILITSHTHSAVDNLLLRLKKYSLPMLRLGSDYRLNPNLQEYSESTQLKDCKTERSLCTKYDSFPIVGVTCLGSGHAIFLHRRFDYCIVDEASQVMQPTVLRPLFYSSKFILVGDPDQLPPLIRSKEARSRGADESLFQRLDSPEATSVLTLQYRMNKTITRLANELTYGGALQCANSDIQTACIKLNLNNENRLNAPKWLQRVLQSHVDQSVFLLNTLDCAERSQQYANSGHQDICAVLEEKFDENTNRATLKMKKNQKRLNNYTNYCEAAVIFYILRILLENNYDAERIGIIAPYRPQVELLKRLRNELASSSENRNSPLKYDSVEVNTVDQYQGRDKDIILYSGSKTGRRINTESTSVTSSRETEILEDKRRLTVAITRAKHKLILVGDAERLEDYTPFKLLLKRIPSFCKLNLEDGKMDFCWENVFDHLNNVTLQDDKK